MLTRRQNFLETIRGGKPDRFVNQYEYLAFAFGLDPLFNTNPQPAPGTEVVNGWGVTIRWQEGQPGPFPVHDAAHKVIKDVTKWKDVIRCPRTEFPGADWAAAEKAAETIDRKETFLSAFVAPGVFEQLHYLMGVDDCLINFYEEPEAMKELIEYITEYELSWAKEYTSHVKPDALFHHDDWGSQNSSFMSPDMFREFILPAYKKIYGFYKKNGVEIIVHHSDSYAANLVPMMIEMGIDVFQGCSTTNNVPELVKKYGSKIAFMGDLNNGVLDKADWTPELVRKEVERACRTNGKLYFIPCLTMGGPMSIFPGVYDAVSEEIDRMSKEKL
jgi:uroporphyrinogen-III decarboxylase